MLTDILPNRISRFYREEEGATAIEYAIVAAILGVAVVGTLGGIRDSLNETFTTIGTDLADNNTP